MFHRSAGLGATLGAVLALAPAALANTYVANKLGDHAPNACTHSDCTLREAITKANKHPGPDTVVLRGGKVYNLRLVNVAADEDANATGDLDVLRSLTIRSSKKTLATVDANGIDRVFEVGPAAPVSAIFKRLVIRGGQTVAGIDQHGGGIDAQHGGALKLLKSKVVANTATDSQGGGIAATNGTLKITRSVIARNSAAEGAGGVSTYNRATITRSTIVNNRAGAGVGGGIFNGDPGTLKVKSSTLSGNTTNNDGGAVEVYGTTRLINDTITKNHAAGLGGGVAVDGNSATLNAVTIARNTAGTAGGIDGGAVLEFRVSNSLIARNSSSGLGPDCRQGPVIVSGGHNLIGDTTDCTGAFGSATHDITNVNPRIAKLADNGGPTKTIALRRHSKAINHAGNDAPKRDQRGVKRHSPDIGAYERR
jgi:CSLREA domain-containing protein